MWSTLTFFSQYANILPQIFFFCGKKLSINSTSVMAVERTPEVTKITSRSVDHLATLDADAFPSFFLFFYQWTDYSYENTICTKHVTMFVPCCLDMKKISDARAKIPTKENVRAWLMHVVSLICGTFFRSNTEEQNPSGVHYKNQCSDINTPTNVS